ncbi:MAG TPA: phosphoglucosamine mutase [Bacteroidales bacterium]|nr:phosphoglucosamine mutase [Bacteroidales bacterium]
MSLIKSISGIRGTIGGKPGDSLSPLDIVKFSAAFGTWVLSGSGKTVCHIVVGRDARKSGEMVSTMVVTTLRSLGINVTDLGLATTPTVEVAVTGLNADGGIIITASHNPSQWNALKLLGKAGEFVSSAEGTAILEIAEKEDFIFVEDERRGSLVHDDSWNKKHIEKILSLGNVDVNAIRSADFSVALDCINSVGALILPDLLHTLGVNKITGLNMTPDGNFAHTPEPLPENLRDIAKLVVSSKSDLGIVVDPDVDRLALVCEDGSMFGEEYTLVAVSDYVLQKTPGDTVSNLSSSIALRDISEKHGCRRFSSAVGEVNVVEEMKRRNAVIGGEGNGGVIYPALHYGRDALVGIALFLSHLARSGKKCTDLRQQYPSYYMSKKKLQLDPSTDFSRIIDAVKKNYPDFESDERDGLWIGNGNGWVQIRKSNTEPIMRIYAEGRTMHEADSLADAVIAVVKKI